MKKTAYLILIGILWIQVLQVLAEWIAPLDLIGNAVLPRLAAGLVQDSLLFAVASLVLALLLFLSNYRQFSTLDIAISAAPITLAGLVGLIVYSLDVPGWMFAYQLLTSVVSFMIIILVVPFYLKMANKLATFKSDRPD